MAQAQTFQMRRMSYVGKCIWAKKSFFLLVTKDPIYSTIPDNIYLNGKVLFFPHKGTQDFKFVWDTSSLSIAIDESNLCKSVCQHDKEKMNALKLACCLFDQMYPSE
jgi:hypothetical protein